MLDLVIRDARMVGRTAAVVDIGVRGGLVASIGPQLEAGVCEIDAAGELVVPGLVDTHIHLDKSHTADRCLQVEGTLAEAIAETSRIKKAFTAEDVYLRSERTLLSCIQAGTTRMRTHVEVDPAVELRSLEAIQQLATDYSWAIDIQVCVFAQEGLTDRPETDQLLVRALERGAQAIGGAPYADVDPRGQIDRVFALAADFDVDIDLHLDLTEDRTMTQLAYVCAQTRRTGYEGRVAVGHLTQLALLDPQAYARCCDLVASSGVAVTVLPSTDLYLMGRAATHAKPRGVAPLDGLLNRGVACSVATNNVVNAFTPYGDGSLIRMANLYANVCHQGTDVQLARCLDLVTSDAARVIGAADYGIHVGAPADLVGLGATTAALAVAEIAPTRWGVKAGVQTFRRPRSVLVRP